MRFAERMACLAVMVWPLVAFSQVKSFAPGDGLGDATLTALSMDPRVAVIDPRVATILERLAKAGDRDAVVKEMIDLGPFEVPGLVKALGDSREEVRSAAAEALRTLTKDPELIPGYHTRGFWEWQIAQMQKATSYAEAMGILARTAADRQMHLEFGTAGGQTSSALYRVDDYWMISIDESNGKISRNNPPRLVASMAGVEVKLPEKFSGVATTYFVSGQKGNVISYKDGKYDGLYQLFFENGAKSLERHYTAGAFEGSETQWYSNGQKSYAGQYVGGKQDGVWMHGDEKGEILWRHVFKDGKLVEGQ